MPTDLLALYAELAEHWSDDLLRDLSEAGLPLDPSLEAAMRARRSWESVEDCSTVPEQCFVEGLLLGAAWRGRRGA